MYNELVLLCFTYRYNVIPASIDVKVKFKTISTTIDIRRRKSCLKVKSCGGCHTWPMDSIRKRPAFNIVRVWPERRHVYGSPYRKGRPRTRPKAEKSLLEARREKTRSRFSHDCCRLRHQAAQKSNRAPVLIRNCLFDESSAVGQFGADAPSGLRAASTAHEEEPAAKNGEQTDRSNQLPRDTGVKDPLQGAQTTA